MVDRSHLVPVKKPIKGKTPYMAIRYVSIDPKESKKRLKEFLGVRKKESYITRYAAKHPADCDVYTREELEESLEPTKTGEKYYDSFNTKLIDRSIVFRKPEQVNDVTRLIVLIDGRTKVRHSDIFKAKENAKKFKRVKKTGKRIDEFRDKYKKMMEKPGADKPKQLGIVLALMDTLDVRVGSGSKGVREGPIKVSDLTRGMVIQHPSWPIGTPNHIVTEVKMPEGVKKLFLRSIDKEEEFDKLRELKKQINSLSKRLKKEPENRDMRLEHENLTRRAEELSGKVLVSIPPKWTEVTRVGHYGSTQLESRHIKYPSPGEVWLDFIAKSGKRLAKKIDDPILAKAIKDCQKGKAGDNRLFPDVKRLDTAKLMKKYGIHTPKDLRTYDGTKTFVEESSKHSTPTTKQELRKTEKAIFLAVSKKLGNTPSMAKNAYTDPIVYASWKAGILEGIMKGLRKSFYVILEK